MITRFSAKILSLLGFIFGFTSEVLAQYGAPVYFYTVKGNVKDIECNYPVKNARVKLIDRNSDIQQYAYTDSVGNFVFAKETRTYNPEFSIKIEDSDVEANGLFKNAVSIVDVNTLEKHSNKNQDSAANDVYFIEYISNSPCGNTETTKRNYQKNKSDSADAIKNKQLLLQEEAKNNHNDTTLFFSDVMLFYNSNSEQLIVEFNALGKNTIIVEIKAYPDKIVYFSKHTVQAGFNQIEIYPEFLNRITYYYLKLQCGKHTYSKEFYLE